MQKSDNSFAVRFWGKYMSVGDIKLAGGKQYKLYNLPYYYAGQMQAFTQQTINKI